MAARTRGGGAVANPNLQQSYYQATAYGPNLQLVLDPYYARMLPAPIGTKGMQRGMNENARDQVA
jgi:hypothetical protein